MTPRDSGMITVPAGTKPRHCRGLELGGSCARRLFMAIDPRTRQTTAIDCDVVGGRDPSETTDTRQQDFFLGLTDVHDGRGVRHMPMCPDRERIIAAMRERDRADIPAKRRA